jgi:hypothetical protein
VHGANFSVFVRVVLCGKCAFDVHENIISIFVSAFRFRERRHGLSRR